MAKDPDHRYQTADDMRADLLRFRRGRPLAAAPVTALVAEVPTVGAAGRRRAVGARRRPRRCSNPTVRARRRRRRAARRPTAGRAAARALIVDAHRARHHRARRPGRRHLRRSRGERRRPRSAWPTCVEPTVREAKTQLEDDGFKVTERARQNADVPVAASSARTRSANAKADEGQRRDADGERAAPTGASPDVDDKSFADATTHPHGAGFEVQRQDEASVDRRQGPRDPHRPGRRRSRHRRTRSCRSSCPTGVEQITSPTSRAQTRRPRSRRSATPASPCARSPSRAAASARARSRAPTAGRHEGRPRRDRAHVRVEREPAGRGTGRARPDRRPDARATLSGEGLTSSVITAGRRRERRQGDRPDAGRRRQASNPAATSCSRSAMRERPRATTTGHRRPDRTVTAASALAAWYARARPPRSAVAGDARPLGGARVGSDAAPDAGRARRARGRAFMPQFPDAATAAAAGPGAVIAAWGRLGYPRRARRLWEAAVVRRPRRLARRPARPARRRALHRGRGRRAGRRRRRRRHRGQHPARVRARRGQPADRTRRRSRRDRRSPAPLRGRDRLLALMDLGATVCTAREPACAACPIAASCATRGALADETRTARPRYEGSFRQRRGSVLARAPRRTTRSPSPTSTPKRSRRSSRRPRRSRRHDGALPAGRDAAEPARRGEEVAQEVVAGVGEDRLGVELHALDRELAVAQAHHQAVLGLGGDLEHVGHRVAVDDERVVAGRGERVRQPARTRPRRCGGSPTSCRASPAARARPRRRRARRCTGARGTRRAPGRPLAEVRGSRRSRGPRPPGGPGPGEIEHRVGRERVASRRA